METSTVERQRLLEAVRDLPEDVLAELASFLNYLRYKSVQHKEVDNHSASFLAAVAGLGNSGQQDISERDEEILRNELDPVRGWGSEPSNIADFDSAQSAILLAKSNFEG